MHRRYHLLPQGPEAVKTYLREAKDIGFDALELDTGRVVLEPHEELQLVEDVQKVPLFGAAAIGNQCHIRA